MVSRAGSGGHPRVRYLRPAWRLQAKHRSGFRIVRGYRCSLSAATMGNPFAPGRVWSNARDTLAAQMKHGSWVSHDTGTCRSEQSGTTILVRFRVS